MILMEEEEFSIPSAVIEIDDLATKIWQRYFKPEEALAPATRKALMERYNALANQRNKLSGFKALVLITPSMRVDTNRTCTPPGIGAPSKINPSTVVETVGVEKATGSNIIQRILALHVEGLSNKEIIERGFNKSTVARQVSEYKKRKNNGQ